MRKRYWFVGVQALAVAVLLLVSASRGSAQVYKRLPIITLVKSLPVGNDDVTSQDTQYVAEAGPGEKRYFLLPVYLNNTLDSIPNTVKGTGAEPIFSFRCKIQYNRTLLRAIGVQKRGLLPQDTVVAAKYFNLSWDIDEDSLYKLSTIGTKSANGERIMITGSSSLPLPLPLRSDAPPNRSDDRFRDTAVFFYVLFEVVGRAQLSGGGVGNRDQMIITNDTLEWNNYPATGPLVPTVPQFMINKGFDPNPRSQQGIAPTPIFPIAYPNNYGSSVIVITQQPRIELFPVGQVVNVNGNPSLYQLTSWMETYYGNNNYIFRNLLLRNSVPGAVLRNVAVQTDQAWLRVDTNNPVNPGVGAGGTPPGDRGIFIRQIPNSQINLNIVANPSFLPTDANGYPTPGLYTGYVTFFCPEASNSAVKLKVVLLVTRNPLEPGLNGDQEPVNPRGIQLLVRNSAPSPDTTYLTFGTGKGARDSVDTLFGEAEAPTYPVAGTFYARFFPPVYDAQQNPAFNGLIDNRGVTPKPTNGESSIDVRNYKANTTIVYCVRFSAGPPQNYPLIVEYDTRDFPTGAQLFVRDNLNGRFFSTNMRQATSLGGTRRYFVIQDPNITGFCIEYTLPSVVQFPEINSGWNLVSLPVLPSDARSSAVFPNMSSGKPGRFTQNQYQFDDTVQVGCGYFVKYGVLIDRTVAGTPVRRIHEQLSPFSVRLYKGWNTVGGLSVPTTIDPLWLNFGPIASLPQPNRVGEVYRYITDRGYEQASLIAPGFGYWLKVDGDGYYRLNAPASAFPKAPAINDAYKTLNRLTVSDDAQKVGTVYFGQTSSKINNAQFELPPAPPTEMFDVRFDNNGFVSASPEVAVDRVLSLQGASYPVVLSVDNADADYVVTDAATGTVIGQFTHDQMSSITITNTLTKSVKITGVASSDMSLGAAFPNPAAAKFNFDFNIPTEQHVSITLYSALGNEVAHLFDASAKGRQTVEFSTDGLPAGVYYYKMITAEGFSQVRQIVIAK